MQNYEFYVMVWRMEGAFSTEFLRIGDSSIGDVVTCEVCGQPVGPRSWLPPYTVELEAGGTGFGDIALSHVSQDILVTSAFKEVYDKSGLTGLSGFEPVKVNHVKKYKKFEGEAPLYRRAHILRGMPAIDPVASEVEWTDESVCNWCLIGTKLKRRRRIVINQSTWSGEDVFFARGLPGEPIVSRRFKEVCDTNGLTNIVLVPSLHRR